MSNLPQGFTWTSGVGYARAACQQCGWETTSYGRLGADIRGEARGHAATHALPLLKEEPRGTWNRRMHNGHITRDSWQCAECKFNSGEVAAKNFAVLEGIVWNHWRTEHAKKDYVVTAKVTCAHCQREKETFMKLQVPDCACEQTAPYALELHVESRDA